LRTTGKSNDAIACYRRAIELKPDDAIICNSLGIVLVDIGRHDEAMTYYRHALELDPNYAAAHYNLGIVLQELARFDDALVSYRRALQIDPLFSDAYSTIGNTLKDQGKMPEAMESYRQALRLKPDYFDAHSNLLFSCNYMPHQDPASLLAEAVSFGNAVNGKARPFISWENNPAPDRALRIGLVSGDLRHHPVGFFLEGILAALASNAPTSLKLVAYSTTFATDVLSQRLRSYCHEWHSVVGVADEHLAHQIHDDQIDILIDLSGHSAHNRLPMFAWKPAPVQVTWLGYFATTGVKQIDYLIADPWTLPNAEENHFTEQIWRLPETRLCFTAPNNDVSVSPLPASRNGFITFGCFNNLSKMSDDVVRVWSAIMHAVPDSRLFLKAGQLNQTVTHQRVVDRFSVHGIGADRLILQGFSSRADYLAAYHNVDLALDPFPYTGGTTTVEALWMGVPVLTLAGASFVSQQGVGLMMNARLPDWIATDADDYVSKAVQHASDLQSLTTLRGGLREQVLHSPLFDAPRFAHHFEAALRGMWTQWCAQQQQAQHAVESRIH
ncbi:MAG TPA: tetratricopeptide repeat protein, partial [Burkholderiaceae bacterium]|nr:tetratricopeptide repeat protein [Burkholderiaceae bacterium]